MFKALRELVEAASSRPAPYGICPYPSSRAIYAVDLMLKWSTGQNGKHVKREGEQAALKVSVIRLCW